MDKEKIEAAAKEYAKLQMKDFGLKSGTEWYDKVYKVFYKHYIDLHYSNQYKWISVNDRLPEPSTILPKKTVYVLIHLDYSKWGRNTQYIEKASVHYSESQPYGGPNSLTGRGIIKGIYFAIPAICNPEAVTHWMELPPLASL